MQLYNALTRQKEEFKPAGEAVTIYVCGITPYDTTHLGHVFTYASFDVLIRYLEETGYTVRYVQNVTDIDDDILQKADEVGGNWKEVGDRWTTHFIRDMKALNMRPPEYFPRATDVVEEMIEVIQALLAGGHAYEQNGSVYFHVDSWEEFGKLSRLPRSEMLAVANERGNRPDDPNKKDPLDFVLWQAQAPGEPAWDSPWGPGRPGWHIECSTMACHYLGHTIDIHGGGADLMFPHHDSEIAQTVCATGEEVFVRYWMHTAMVRHDGEKMSKSLGNLIMVRDLLDQGWSPDALRLYMHQYHYREEWEFDESRLQWAAELARLLRRAVTVAGGAGKPNSIRGPVNTFKTAMEDDLDTPTAIACLEQFAHEIVEAAERDARVDAAQKALRRMGSVLGLYLDNDHPEERVVAGWTEILKKFA